MNNLDNRPWISYPQYEILPKDSIEIVTKPGPTRLPPSRGSVGIDAGVRRGTGGGSRRTSPGSRDRDRKINSRKGLKGAPPTRRTPEENDEDYVYDHDDSEDQQNPDKIRTAGGGSYCRNSKLRHFYLKLATFFHFLRLFFENFENFPKS